MTPFERALVGELEGSHGDRVHVGDVHGATALHHYAGLNSLADVELLITGWGAPDLSSGALELLPRLRAIVHTGGGVSCAQEAAGRGIMVSSARQQNALPVAQYTMAMITLAAKDIPWASRTYPAQQRFIDREAEHADTGLDGRSVGIVGASTIGELVIRSQIGRASCRKEGGARSTAGGGTRE